jgi:hypothetical protein
MKTPEPSNENPSAPNSAKSTAFGNFPPRYASVCADVLARLLNHERLTSLDAVGDASTTRLAAVVHYLVHQYGWTINAADKAKGCRDGRVAWVAEYTLPAGTVAGAMAAGAELWCAKVRAARAALRAKAAEAQRRAARLNAARRRRPHPDQWGLFDGERAE